MASSLGVSAFAGDVAVLRGRSRGEARGNACRVVTTAKESRIGKNSVKVPKGVTVTVKDNLLVAKARVGKLCRRRRRRRMTPPRSCSPRGPRAS
jgi:hypothetical protein